MVAGPWREDECGDLERAWRGDDGGRSLEKG